MPHSPSFPTPSFKQKDWRAPRRSVSALARLLRRAIGARSSIPASIPALLSAPWSRRCRRSVAGNAGSRAPTEAGVAGDLLAPF
jgi:hypothetical protein